MEFTSLWAKMRLRIKQDQRGISNVIVVMLSLVILVTIVANVILWSYQMNQLDWEKMQEKVEIVDVARITSSSWFVAQNEYTVNIGSRTSGTYTDTQAVDDQYETFTEASPSQDWLTGWDKRVKITIDHSDITSALTHFPVLIHLSSACGKGGAYDLTPVFDEVGSNSKRIAVTKDDRTSQLFVEIEKWDDDSEQAWLWVKVPSISKDADTDLYLYYDKSHADNTTHVGDNADGSDATHHVWDEDGVNKHFKMVQHLKEDPSGTAPQMKDSTSNDNDGTSGGAMTSADQVSGQVDGSLDFDGSDDYVEIADSPELRPGTNNFTVGLWIKAPFSGSNIYEGILSKGLTMAAPAHTWGFLRYTDWTNKLFFGQGPDAGGGWGVHLTTSALSDGWHFIVATRDGNTAQLYEDGSYLTEDATAGGDLSSSAELRIGQEAASRCFNGTIDEVRISNTARSAAWIKASYETGRDDLLDFGSEEAEWLGGWAKRVKIMIDHNDIDSDLTHFPVLIHLSATCGKGSAYNMTPVFDEVGSNSKRIAVTKDDRTSQLFVEIEKWDATGEEAWLWVSRDGWSIAHDADTDIYLYYDNSQPDNDSWVGDSGSRTEVWDGSFQGVWHLSEDPSGTAPQIKDSTSNNVDGTSASSMTSGDQISGQIDGSLDFDGTDDDIGCGTSQLNLDGSANMTVELWVKRPDTTKWHDFAFLRGDIYGKGKPFHIRTYGGPMAWAFCTTGGDTGTISTGITCTTNWQYHVARVHIVASGDDYELYTDMGTPTTGAFSQTGNLSSPTGQTISIGGGWTNYPYKGAIDECRVSNTARSVAWLKASYETAQDDLLDFGVMSDLELDIVGVFVFDLSTYPLTYIQTVEIQSKYRATDTGENWHLKAYNWTSADYSDNGFNITTGHTPTTGWDYYAVNLTNQWRSYVRDDGTMYVKLHDEEGDFNQTSIDIDFLGIRAVIDGVRFVFKNSGSLTTHLVSLWIINSTVHQRYDISVFVNSGEILSYLRVDICLPSGQYVVKVVTERGNIAVYSGS